MPVGADGSINVFSSQGTHLILDISGYYLSTLEAGDQFAIVGNNSSAAIVGVNNGTGAGVRGESASGVAGYFAGNAVVTGNLGVGTETPGSKLTVAGMIESRSGGIKFPDGTVQTSASADGGGNNYIRNTTTQQTADFNISGNGTVANLTAGGAVSASIVNAATQYNLGGSRVLSVAGFFLDNLFVGINAGTANTTGSSNSFVGEGAGRNNTTGGNNSFIGREAGLNNTTGSFNSFFGTYAGRSNTMGSSNLFVGQFAGVSNTTGGANSFFGNDAGSSNTAGFQNSFIGALAGFGNTTGSYNSFVGLFAGSNNTTGENNTIIGHAANVGADNLTFATAIGSFATVSTSNTIVLGRENGSDKVRIFGLGAAGSTQLCRNADNEISTCSSSLRYKTNIAPFRFGLSFINQLRPISFAWKDGGMTDVGFGAEDVARLNSLFVTYNAAGEVEGVKYDRLSAVFVNAFKEQQAQIERQQKQLDELPAIKAENAELKAQLAQLKQIVCTTNPTAAICRQP